MTEPTATGGRPRQFTDDDILRATVGLVEAEGIGRLTMRRLGKALGVEAMAIYRYFPSRQELVTALVDWVVLETSTDPELQFDHADDWRDYLDRLAHGIRQMALTHPRVFPLIATTPTTAPWIRPPMRSLQWVDAFLAGLQDHHFPPSAAVTVYKRFSSFLLGHLLLEVAALDADRGRPAAPADETDADRRVARAQRTARADAAEAAMAHGDGPEAEEIVAAATADRAQALADEPAVLAAEPGVAAETAAAQDALPSGSTGAEADLPLAAAMPAAEGPDLGEYPHVRELAGLLAADSAPVDFERDLDRLLDDMASLRRP